MAFTTGSTPFGVFDNDPLFQQDADKVIEYTRLKLGDPVLQVELAELQMYACFEEACLEYSAIINQYQAKSALASFLGSPTGSLQGSENSYPNRVLDFQNKMAEAYADQAGLNSHYDWYSGSIDLVGGVQKYDLKQLLPLSGADGNPVRIRVRKIHHYSPISAYRFFGTTSAVNYLNNQFQFESFTPETVFYMLPIWEDVLRGMQFELSNKVRRSHYSYELHNNVLTLYPAPTQALKVWIDYSLEGVNPMFDGDGGLLSGSTFVRSAASYGVSNLSNVPFGNIQYSAVNSIGRQWIWKMAYVLCKETLGHVRRKMQSIPIPNGDLQLDGDQLVSDARSEMEALRGELRGILEELTYEKLAEREAKMAEDLRRALAEAPLGIYLG